MEVSCCLCALLRQIRDSQKQPCYEQSCVGASPDRMLLSHVLYPRSGAEDSMEVMQGAIQNRPVVPTVSCLLLFNLFVLF